MTIEQLTSVTDSAVAIHDDRAGDVDVDPAVVVHDDRTVDGLGDPSFPMEADGAATVGVGVAMDEATRADVTEENVKPTTRMPAPG
ncbi:hypothetical protein RRG08_018937 [Elysia crispata]|uniref:Uncharacterized protein n=1 Tax=Elysia crispata TaxID=231223 RepID=A0AAE1A517_9GAST|nr:hypothetical protein RRG08_018937 [Elysia crispata]